MKSYTQANQMMLRLKNKLGYGSIQTPYLPLTQATPTISPTNENFNSVSIPMRQVSTSHNQSRLGRKTILSV